MHVRIKQTLGACFHFLERGPYGLIEVFRYYTRGHTHTHKDTQIEGPAGYF